MKKIYKVVLLAVLMLCVLPVSQKVSAGVERTKLIVPSKLTDWILDEQNNMIYAISEEGSSAFFINAKTMQIVETITFSGKPTDLLLDNGELYIALYKSKKINVIDVKKRVVSKTIETVSEPWNIAKDGSILFYVENNQTKSYVYRYDLTTKEELKVSGGESFVYDNPVLEVDRINHKLYIGCTDIVYNMLYSYDIKTDEKMEQKVRYRVELENGVPANIEIQGDTLYYIGHKFLIQKSGELYDDGDYRELYDLPSYRFHAITENLVYMNHSVFERENHRKIGTFITTPTLLKATNSAMYVYSKWNQTIEKVEDTNQKITKDNVARYIGLRTNYTQPDTIKSSGTIASYRTLNFIHPMSKWELDVESNTVFGIAPDAKAVYCINATTLDLEKTIVVKNTPSKIEVDGNYVYVTEPNSNRIICIDKHKRTIVKEYRLSYSPTEFVVNAGNIIYYNDGYLYIFDMQTKQETKVNAEKLLSCKFKISYKEQMLYYTSSSQYVLYYYDITARKLIGQTERVGGISAKIFADENQVYWGDRAFDKKNPTIVKGIYKKNSSITKVKNGLVYVNKEVYDAKTYKFLYEMTEEEYEQLNAEPTSGRKYENSFIDGKFVMIDRDNIANVSYDLQDGSAVTTFMADKNQLLKAPATPVRKGYLFLGWYRMDNGSVIWNFSKDKVTGDVTLVPRWKRGIQVPGDVKASVNSNDNIVIRFNQVADATRYEIYRATSENGQYALVATVGNTEYLDLATKWGTRYYYKVRAVYEEGSDTVYSELSHAVSARSCLDAVRLSVSSFGTKASLSWNRVNGANGYVIYRCNTKTGNYVKVGTTGGLRFDDKGLKLNATYYYKVCAYKSVAGKYYYGDNSAIAQIKLSQKNMSKVTVTATAEGYHKVSFGKIDGMREYEVYRATSANGSYVLIGKTNGSSYIDKKVTAGQNYYYRVRGYRNSGSDYDYTTYSATVSKTAVLVAPSKPKAVKKNKTTVVVSWKKAKDATGYEVYQATKKTGSYKKIATTKSISFTNKNLKKGKTYYYKVRTYRQVGKKKVYSNYTTIIAIKL